MSNVLANAVKDPLCHLLVIGAVVYGLTQPTNTEHPRDIYVTPEFVAQLEQQFHHVYLRHPTPEEQQHLLNNAVMDLALYKEGLQYKLDQADEVVKRRVIQKMNFIIEGMAEPGSPELSDLDAFLKENPERFMLPEQYSFEHHFINGHSAQSEKEAGAMTLALQSGEADSPSVTGDYFLRGQQFRAVNADKINTIFGQRFAQHLQNQPEGQWLGPFPSTYGFHAVRINQHIPARAPELAEVKDRVYAAWKKAQTEANVARIKQQLLVKYQVNIARGDAIRSDKEQNEAEQHVALN